MTKNFSLIQLFSIADGRLSTNIGDVYEMLNHVCNDDLMTHHLPVAKEYVESKKPKWLQEVKSLLLLHGITKQMDFKEAMEIIKSDNKTFEVPQLKDEVDTSDYINYMMDNSLLLKKDI